MTMHAPPVSRSARPGGLTTPSLGVRAWVDNDRLVLTYATDGARGPARRAWFVPVQADGAGRWRPHASVEPQGCDTCYLDPVQVGPVRVEFMCQEWHQLSYEQDVVVVLAFSEHAGLRGPELLQEIERFFVTATSAELRRGRISARILVSRSKANAVNFALASCQYPSTLIDRTPADARVIGPADASLCRLAHRLDLDDAPTLLLLAGDQIYADASAGLFDIQRLDDRYRLAHEDRYAARGVQEIAGRIEQHMVLDDHEIEADWEFDDREGRQTLAEGLTAYWLWQRSIAPAEAPDRRWSALRHRGFDFFLADARSEREPRQADDFDVRSIMRSEQFEALCKWLAEGGTQPKFVVCASMLLPRRLSSVCAPEAALHSDAWDGYPASLHSLLAHLCEAQVHNAVFLSGDEHVGCVCEALIERLGPDGSVEASTTIHSIHTPALYAPYPFANSRAEHFADDEIFSFSIGTPQRCYRCTVRTRRPTIGDGFTVLAVTESTTGGWTLNVEFDHQQGVAGADRFRIRLD